MKDDKKVQLDVMDQLKWEMSLLQNSSEVEEFHVSIQFSSIWAFNEQGQQKQAVF